MNAAIRRFACTQCGKCCNRSPEVQLSEASALSDVFVFRLMFRPYWLPRDLKDYRQLGSARWNASAIFHQKKRLLAAYAAHQRPARMMRDGRAMECTRYLTISALALDTSPGACRALRSNRCSIYERRPLACRTVPFHYSRVEAAAESDLQAFVETPGYRCETGDTAPVVMEAGRILDAGALAARTEALSIAKRDRRWQRAIVRRLKAGSATNTALPSLHEIDENAQFGATTMSMSIAWQIAAEVGLISADEYGNLIAAQLTAIERELSAAECPPDSRATLVEMQTEYRNGWSVTIMS